MATSKTYIKPSGPVYVDSRLWAAGEAFTTDAEVGEGWEEVSPVEKAAIDASDKTKHPDPNFDALSATALDAVAAVKKVDTTDLGKADKVTAIKAASDPSL